MTLKYTHPDIATAWHSKNTFGPDTVGAGSERSVWWQCKTQPDHLYSMRIDMRTRRHQSCPKCVNKTEAKLYSYLVVHYSTLITQFKLPGCKLKRPLPFDFLIPELKTIIELDGGQHFRQVRTWLAPEEVTERDVYKMRMAAEAGYRVIRIYQEDVYSHPAAWLDEQLIPIIKNGDKNHRFITTVEGLYDKHIKLLDATVPS